MPKLETRQLERRALPIGWIVGIVHDPVKVGTNQVEGQFIRISFTISQEYKPIQVFQ